MIVDPNESRWTAFLRNSDGKIPCWKKILLVVLAVHLVFTVLDACVFHGPFAGQLIDATGPGKLFVGNTEYRIRPRQNEIVMTWTESVIRNRSQLGKGKGEKHSRTIPLDPMPPEFARCYVDVTIDQNAPPMTPEMHFNSDEIAPMPYFGEGNVIGTDPEVATGQLPTRLPPDMVFHLRVRPEDVSALSGEFVLTYSRYSHPTMMFPYSKANSGRRAMLMTANGIDPYPYYNEICWEAEARPHKMPSRVGGMLLRIVLMPFATVPDYVMLIGYIFFLSRWAAAFK